jgi:hypothetical protein
MGRDRMITASAADDDLPRTKLHSFIVRLWQEPSSSGVAQRRWRGSVAHVGDGARAFFLSFDELVGFLAKHSGALMHENGIARRILRWARRRTTFWSADDR